MDASAAVSYFDFLNLLLKLGSNLGPAVALIKAAVEDFQDGWDKLQKLADLLVPKPAEGSAPVALSVGDGLEITADVLEAESKLLALSRQNGLHASKLGDGTALRTVWQFVQEHPELMKNVARILMGLAGSPAA